MTKLTKLFDYDNTNVIGKVFYDGISYRASWLVPKGFYSEGQFLFIGEYASKEIAEKKIMEFLEVRELEAVERFNRDIENEKSRNHSIKVSVIFSAAIVLIITCILFALLN